MDKSVAAWFRGQVDLLGHNLKRLTKYTSIPKGASEALMDAVYQCNRASAIMQGEEKKEEVVLHNDDGFGCFTAGHRIQMVWAGLLRPIQSIIPGDEVQGWDMKKNSGQVSVVKRVILSKTNKVYEIKLLLNGITTKIECTPKQRFLKLYKNKSGGLFTEAQHLRKDNLLFHRCNTEYGNYTVDSITKKEKDAVVYGLEMEVGNNRNFFVEDILVHNLKV